jgi:hypothetical protein
MEEQGPYSLLAALDNVKDLQKPPIHLWNPVNVKDIDMEIKKNGDWFYLGTKIERQRLVHLFASVLRLEDDGSYYLVTPVEKCRIKVNDVPFLAVLMDITGEGESQQLSFTTNMAEQVHLSAEHALRFEFDLQTSEPSPYLHVRDGLEARLSRSVYYQLVELMQEKTVNEEDWLGIWSDSIFFLVIRKEEIYQ